MIFGWGGWFGGVGGVWGLKACFWFSRWGAGGSYTLRVTF